MTSPKRVLLVEVDSDQLACLSTILELNGYSVKAVSSGAEGLKALHSEPIDIVVSDVAMPEMNGPSFVSQLRQISGCGKIPVLLLTAGQSAVDFSKVSFRADGFLMKKDLPQSLLNGIKNLC